MSYNLQKAAQQRYLPAGVYTLLTISHSLFDRTYYLINNTESVTIDNITYEPYPLNFKPKNQGDNTRSPLVLSNVDQAVVRELVKAKNNEDVSVQVDLALIERTASEYIVEKESAGKYIVDTVSVTSGVTSMTLDLDNSLNFNIGTIRYGNPVLFPNLSR